MLDNIITLISNYTGLSSYAINNLVTATYQTIYMTFIATILVAIFGFFIGVALFITQNNKTPFSKIIYQILAFVVNILRSIPFIILIILLIPISKILTGTILGPNAAIPSLVIGLAPFYARMVETSLNEVDKGIIELAASLGANKKALIFKFLLPESLASLISNLTNIAISMIGFSAISGLIGAGGLGNLAYLEGFERHNYLIIYIAVVIILLLILIIQSFGNLIVKLIKK
ncbi:methionine ABC transporter permease [Rickettsiales bacterium LUAb2]